MTILDFLSGYAKLTPYQKLSTALSILLATSIWINVTLYKNYDVERLDDKREIDSLRTAMVNITIKYNDEKTQIHKSFYEELRKISEENDRKLDEIKHKRPKK